MIHILLNILFAFLAFFIVRWLGSLVTPEGKDRDQIITIVAIIIAIIVFLSNLASQIKSF